MPEGPARVRSQGSIREAVREFYAAESRNAERIQKFNLGLTDDDELPPYVPGNNPYPKALYSPDGDPIVVQDEKEEKAQLADGYYGSLAELKAAENGAQADDPSGLVIHEAEFKRSHKKKT